MKKRVLTFLLFICLISNYFTGSFEASTISGSEHAKQAQLEGNARISGFTLSQDWTWEYYENEDGTVEVTKYCRTPEDDTMCDVIIPETIDDKTVVGVGYSYQKFEVPDKSKVRSITVPATVDRMALEAFEGFTNMTDFVFLGVLSFDSVADALKGCSSLTTLTYGDGWVDLSYLEGVPVATLNFTEGVEFVNVYNNDSSGMTEEGYLTAINFPSTVINVNLSNQEKLQEINLPSSVESFGFRDCPSLSAVNCEKLTTEMDVNWLENCPNLKIEVQVKSNGMPSINNAGITKLIIDGNVWDKYAWDKYTLNNCQNLQEIVVTGENNYYFTRDGALFWRKGTDDPYCDLVAYPAGKNAGIDYQIPEDVRCIYYNAFNSCKCATITIPENIPDAWYWDYSEGYQENVNSLSFLSVNQAVLRLIGSNDKIETLAYLLKVPENRIQLQLGNTYKITYELNGGRNAVDNPSSYRAGEYIKLKNPTKEGYKFLGWIRNDVEIGYEDTTVRYKKFQDYTFRACWEKASSGNITNPSTPIKPGSSTNTENPSKPSNTPSPSTTGQEMFTIFFDGNGGTVIGQKSITRKDNQQLGKLPSAQRKGYLFRGWYLQKAGGRKISSYTRVSGSGSRTVYARWEKVAKPKRETITSLKKRGKGKFKVQYSGISKVKGYEICYSTNKKFKSSTKKAHTSSLAKTIKGLKKNKTYYVRVRGYRIDSTGSRIYGKYSKVKKVKV